MHGAYKAMARDFDGDGDLDIAAISFYPEFDAATPESFVYLENTGGMKFNAFTTMLDEVLPLAPKTLSAYKDASGATPGPMPNAFGSRLAVDRLRDRLCKRHGFFLRS